MRGNVLAIIATYQERANLPSLLTRLLALPGVDVLIVDDSSPDGTGQLADQWARNESRIAVRHRRAKSGVTSAHLLGFEYALEHGYELVLEMDADLSHLPEDVPRLVAACQWADVAVGSRNIPGGKTIGRSRFREALTRYGNVYARRLLGMQLRDCTGGFRCSRRSAIEAIDFASIRSEGYGFQLELNYAWTKAGMRFAEVPILFTDRVNGESKMSPRIVLESLLIVPQLRLRLIPIALKARPTEQITTWAAT